MLALLGALAAGDRAAARDRYGELFCALADEVELGRRRPGDAWQEHLLERLLADENPFSRKCETAGLAAAGPALLDAAGRDLAALGRLYALDAAWLSAALGGDLPRWDGLRPLEVASPPEPERALRARLAASADWAGLAEPLGE